MPTSSLNFTIKLKSWKTVRACARVFSRSLPRTRSLLVRSGIPISSSFACSMKLPVMLASGICTGRLPICHRIPIRFGASGRWLRPCRRKCQQHPLSATSSRPFTPFLSNGWESAGLVFSGRIQTTRLRSGFCIGRRCGSTRRRAYFADFPHGRRFVWNKKVQSLAPEDDLRIHTPRRAR